MTRGTHLKTLTALAVMTVAYGFVNPPGLPPADRSAIAARFRFETTVLPDVSRATRRTIRAVHPSLSEIAAWISAVGAGVALADLDGDGLSNDICHVDPRTDSVTVSQAGGAGRPSYAPFVLTWPARYDAATMAPMGCLPGDFNEDGRLDLLVYFWGRTPVAYLRADGAPAPSGLVPIDIVAGSERWYTNAATLADVNGDGHADLVIGNYFPDGSRILDAHAAGDERMQHSMSRARNGGSKRLLLWRTAGRGEYVRFEDATHALGASVQESWTLAIGAADLDDDQLPELYFANDFGPDHLLHNRTTGGRLSLVPVEGRRGFATPRSKVVGRDSFKGMGVDFADMNGDGTPDIFVSNIAARFALEESHFMWVSSGSRDAFRRGIAPYTDRSEPLGLSRSGWAWDAKAADFDNDGSIEILQATGFVAGTVNRWPELQELATGNDTLVRHPGSWPRILTGDGLSAREANPFFVRAANGRYYDVCDVIGLSDTRVSRGIAVADIDADGLLDFAVANQWDVSYLHRNRSAQHGAFLGLRLRVPLDTETRFAVFGGGSPAAAPRTISAIGAAVRVTHPDGRLLVGQVDGGNGHSGKRSPDVHFGLGAVTADARVKVEMRWRSRTGEPHRRVEWLAPGWHTVVLGAAATDRSHP